MRKQKALAVAKIPEISEVLYNCKQMYVFARESYGSNRFNKRDFSGATAKRKASPLKVIDYVFTTQCLTGGRSHMPIRKMLIAAYDLGLEHEGEYRDSDEYLKIHLKA